MNVPLLQILFCYLEPWLVIAKIKFCYLGASLNKKNKAKQWVISIPWNWHGAPSDGTDAQTERFPLVGSFC